MNKRIIKKLSGAIKKRLRKINLRQLPENMKMRWYWSKRYDFYLPPETFGCSKNRYNKQAKYEFNRNVKFSILVPLYNTPENFLKEMIGSVLFQTYKNWELCLADGSDAEHNYVEKICKEIAEKDQRIKYQKLEKNGGISKNTNVCIDMATGDYISLFDHDDLLHPCALFETMKAICENDADFVYTDEAVFQSPNVHNINDTMFKPDYSLYYFNSINYICHFSTFKRELLNTIGYYNSEMDGAQDFDLFLRISEVTSKIYHIKKCLYYWRASVSSTAGGLNSKNYALEAGRLALQKHFERINIPAEVYVDKKTNLYRVNYFMSEKPLVSLILINDDTVNMKDYITSLCKFTTYENIEVIFVTNKENDLKISFGEKVKTLLYNQTYSQSMIRNYAAEKSNGDYFVFLDCNLKFLTNNWIEELLMFAQLNNVGAVGGKIYFKNKIFNAGIILDKNKCIKKSHKNYDGNENGYAYRLSTVQNYNAVSSECMMISKKLFNKFHGFKQNYQNSFYDIDLCLRMRKEGYLIVWTPFVEFSYLKDKRTVSIKKEENLFKEEWKTVIDNCDYYYNPNLSSKTADFKVKGEIFPEASI